ALYEGLKCVLNLNIVSPPVGGGVLNDIKFYSTKDEENKRISSYEEEGIIIIYTKHPLILKYKNQRDYNKYLVFVTDLITRTFLEGIGRKKIERSSSALPLLNLDDKQREIDKYVEEEYYKNGVKLHEIFYMYMKGLKRK
ncbi:MAG: hypothetical protein N3D10_03230, partial [Candidatus Micrarchaeota archaeon]|nr:hypothetical protein [Candidatus Micrarchaeota archaeon]